jgi:hypothetical protein
MPPFALPMLISQTSYWPHYESRKSSPMAINRLSSGVKRWQADWTTADGVRQRKRFAVKREAEEFLPTTVRSIRGATFMDPRAATKLTVSQLYEDWIARITLVGAAVGSLPAPRQPITIGDATKITSHPLGKNPDQ